MIWSLQSLPDLSDQQFALWSELLEERAGIYLTQQQRTFLQTQVSMRMREVGCEDYKEYYDTIMNGVAGQIEWSILIDRLVVKETSFFRHQASIDFVSELIADRIGHNSIDGSFDVWSVGCSTGEEPYSLAMVLNDAFQWANREAHFGITGTDISRAALSLAKAGIYSERKLELMKETFRQRYFSPVSEERFQVGEELRDRICFAQGNILNINEMPLIKVDLIFCQNLLVYFRRWRRENIMNAFVERLKPGGTIVIGLGEVVDWTHSDIERVPLNGVQAYVHK